MAQDTSAEDQVIDILLHTQGCNLDEVARRCPTLTWNQVFLAVDRLSRSGKLLLVPKGRGAYTLTLSHRRNSLSDRPVRPSIISQS